LVCHSRKDLDPPVGGRIFSAVAKPKWLSRQTACPIDPNINPELKIIQQWGDRKDGRNACEEEF